MIPVPKKFVKFAITGSIGFIIDFGTTFILKENFDVNAYIANCSGFSLAVINNYLVNKYWTFGERSRPDFMQFFAFLLISMIGLLLNTVLLIIIYNWGNINFYFAKVGATVFVMLWNYFANNKLTYGKSRIGRKRQESVQ